MVEIQLDKTRHLHYSLGAVRDLETALGGKPLVGILRDLTDVGINTLIACLYHGLKHEDRALNSNLILKYLEAHMEHGESLQPLYKAVTDALESTGLFRTAEDVASGKTKTPAPA